MAVHRIIYGTHGAIIEPQTDHPGVLEFDDPLVGEVPYIGLYGLYVAYNPVEQIDKMAELRIQRTAVEIQGAFPGVLVVGVVTIPETAQLSAVYLAEAAFVDDLFDGGNGGIEPVLLDEVSSCRC